MKKNGNMENESRQSRHKTGMKTSSKVIIGICLILISAGVGAIVGNMVSKSNNAVEKKETKSKNSTSESKKDVSENKDGKITQNNNDQSMNELKVGQDEIEKDDGYNIVLNFADGTRRLSKDEPTYKAWQQTTSSAAANGHVGRTNYNQKSFKQLGGVPNKDSGRDTRSHEMKQFNKEYDEDSRTMIQNSIEYHD